MLRLLGFVILILRDSIRIENQWPHEQGVLISFVNLNGSKTIVEISSELGNALKY